MNSKDNRTMMDDNLKQQRERLKTVMEYLRTIGYSQKDIIDKLCDSCKNDEELYEYCEKLDEPTFSGYKSGKIKYIPEKLLQALHKCYNINPDYVRCKSDFILDILGEQYNYFCKFVQSWRAEEREAIDPSGDHYTVKELFLKIDKNFIDFLFEVYKTKALNELGICSSEDEIESLKKVFMSKPDIQEFVLTPVKTHFKIIEDRKKASDSLNNLLRYIQSE